MKRVGSLSLGLGDTYCLVYEKTGTDGSETWHMASRKLPTLLNHWLVDVDRKCISRDLKTLRITLGSNSSFVAWDKSSVRWSNIPQGLEECLQGWFEITGWKFGPPEMLALGANGDYFVRSTSGAVSYSSSALDRLAKMWHSTKSQDRIARGFGDVEVLQHFLLVDPC